MCIVDDFFSLFRFIPILFPQAATPVPTLLPGWQSRPAGSLTAWRLLNGESTQQPWNVNELHFYADRRCDYKLVGIPFGSENVREFPMCFNFGTCDDTSVERINDNQVETAWRARCDLSRVESACPLRSAFIGYDFGTMPRDVRCMQLYQAAHAGYGEGWHISQHVETLELQTWDGRQWRTDKLVFDMLPSRWNFDYAVKKTLWRITADEVVTTWMISEMEFYTNPFCDTSDESGIVQVLPSQRIPVGGQGFDSNAVLSKREQADACLENVMESTCPDKAFDGRRQTYWRGECVPSETKKCGREAHYLGLYFDYPREIRCFKILQHHNPVHAVSTVHISSWDGFGGWDIPIPWSEISDQIEGIQNDLGAGSWNRRPAFSWSMYKFSNAVSTIMPWQIPEVRIYTDVWCSEDMLGTDYISSGADGLGFEVTALADRKEETTWRVACRSAGTGCERFEAWFGVQRTFNRPSFLQENIPRCVVIHQDRDIAHQSRSIQMEVWNGVRWKKPPSTTNIPELFQYPYKTSFYGVGGGTGNPVPGLPGTKWRLRASSDVGIWQILSLEFYKDSVCKPDNEVIVDNRNVRPIGSGFAMGVEFGFYLMREEKKLKTDYGEEGYINPAGLEPSETYDILKAFDKDDSTSWIDIRDKSSLGTRAGALMPQLDYSLWIGLDFGNAPTLSCNCKLTL